MDVIGIDISKLKFAVVLIIGVRSKHAVFSNTEAGFQQLLAWLGKQRPDPACPLHACMEATGNWGLDLADFLHGQGMQVSIVNPLRIKAFGQSELARNKNDKLDAGVIARFCRAQNPPLWVPPGASPARAARTRPALQCPQGCARAGGQPTEIRLCLSRRRAIHRSPSCLAG